MLLCRCSHPMTIHKDGRCSHPPGCECVKPSLALFGDAVRLAEWIVAHRPGVTTYIQMIEFRAASWLTPSDDPKGAVAEFTPAGARVSLMN